jgi:excisionase family DNA binding protein
MTQSRVKHPPVPPPPGSILLTVAEAAHELRCSVATVYREIAHGKLTTRKVRYKTFVHRDDLHDYLESAKRRVRPAEEMSVSPGLSRQRISLRAAGLIGDDDFRFKRRPKRS